MGYLKKVIKHAGKSQVTFQSYKSSLKFNKISHRESHGAET